MIDSPLMELTGRLYDAAIGEASWAEVSRRTADLVQGSTVMWAVLHGQELSNELISSGGLSPEQIGVYAEHLAAHDLWTAATFKRRLFNRTVLDADIVAAEQWRRSYIYNELQALRVDVFHLAGALLPLADGQLICLGIHRPTRAAPYTRDAAAKLDQFLPHVRRAFTFRRLLGQLQRQKENIDRSLDSLTIGVLHLDVFGRPVFANDAAEAMLRAADGLSLSHGRVRAAHREQDGRLHDLVRCAAAATGGGALDDRWSGRMAVTRPSGRRDYAVFLTPLGIGGRVALNGSMAAVQMFVTDPGEVEPIDPGILCDLFGLSRNEAVVASRLAAGESLPAIAAARGVSHNTIRTQLAHASVKLQVNSQNELIHRVLTSVAGIAVTKGTRGP